MNLSSPLAPLFGCLCLCASAVAADAIPIGVAWEGKSSNADRINTAMLARLKEAAPQIETEVKASLEGGKAALKPVVDEFEKSKKALVILRTSGAIFLGERKSALPGFVGATNDPVILGVVKNGQAPEGNITGVTYALEYEQMVGTFQSILPNLKQAVIILDEAHKGTPLDQAGTEAACKTAKIALTVTKVKTKEDALAAAKAADTSGAAIILPVQALMTDNAKEIVASVKVPVLSYSENPVKLGALAGVVSDDTKMGRVLADQIIAVLVEKKTVSQIPIGRDTKPQLFLNAKTAERLGLTIAPEVLQAANIIE